MHANGTTLWRWVGALVLLMWLCGRAGAQTVLFVDRAAPGGGDGLSWASAYDDLQEAFDYANTQPMVAEIWVRAGVYTPGTSRSDSFRPPTGKGIYGGFAGFEFLRSQRNPEANPTILSGDVGSAQGAYHVVNATNLAATTTLNGFIIEGGFANGTLGSGQDRGGGLLVIDSNLRVQQCTFRNNATGANRFGGAVAIDGDSSPRFTRCVFESNSVGSGGAGGAINVRGSGNSRYTNCIFRDNGGAGGTSSGGAIASAATGTVTFTNCIFAANRAGTGGAVHATATGPVRVINSTLHANEASGAAGGIANAGGDVTVRNTILWANFDGSGITEAAQLSNVGAPISTSITYSLIDGLAALTSPGNIDADPHFADADGPDDIAGTEDDNLHLVIPSPCIDSGNNLTVGTDLIDLDDDGDTAELIPLDLDDGPRFTDDPGTVDTGLGTAPLVDMGAYEFDPGQRLLVSTGFINVPEGGSAVFTVALNLPPAGTVTVTVTRDSGDADLSVSSGATVMFNAGNHATPMNVVLAAAQDPDFANGQAIFRISAAGLSDVLVTAQEVDDEILPGNVRTVSSAAPPGGSGLAWSVAYQRLEDALAEAASSGGKVNEIWVAAGSYRPSDSDPEASFDLPDNVRVLGGFAGMEVEAAARDPTVNPTILLGDLDGGGTAAHHVVRAGAVGTGAVLDGFIISGGVADGSSVTLADRGAGFLCLGGSPVIRRCTFENNVALGRGGGVAVESGGPVFINCLFSANAAPLGGALADGPAATMRLINCRVIGNESPATTPDDGRGGGAWISGTPSLFNTILSGNTARTGGGAFVAPGGTLTVANLTIASNGADSAGGGIFLAAGAAANLENSILWANRDVTGETEQAQIDATFGTVSMARCCVLGLTGALGGQGNTGADPRFMDRAGGDGVPGTLDDVLTLFAGSPCIDAGRSGALPADDAFDLDEDGDLNERLPLDITGRERFVNDPLVVDLGVGSPAWVDMGAAEWVPGDAGYEWIDPAGGAWTAPENWRPMPPGPSDALALWRVGTYGIDMPTDVSVATIDLEAGDVRLALNGHMIAALDAEHPLGIGTRTDAAGVALRIDDGELLSQRGVIGSDRGAGTVQVLGAAGKWSVIDDILVNRGVLDVGGAGVSAGAGVDIADDARLEGAGEVDADVRVGGIISPAGTAIGALVLTGDLELQRGLHDASLYMEVDATGADHVEVGGQATLDGLLHVRRGPAAVPAVGHSVDLLSAGTVTGQFDAAVTPHLGAAARYLVETTSDRVTARIEAHVDRIGLAPPSVYGLIGTPTAVVSGDFDGDGDVDVATAIPALVATNAGRVVFVENRGTTKGTWEGLVSRAPIFVEIDPVAMDVAALDDDAGLDLVVAHRAAHALTLLSWNGAGGFDIAGTLTGDFESPVDVVARDVTGDGRADLVVLAATAQDAAALQPGGESIVMTWTNLGGTPATFQLLDRHELGASATALSVEDLDGDGAKDVVVAAARPGRLMILANTAAGVLSPPVSVMLPHDPEVLRVAALGGPGTHDLLTLSGSARSLAWTVHRGGLLYDAGGEIELSDAPLDARAGDLDEDGDVDLILALARPAGPSLEVWRNDVEATGNRLLASGGDGAAAAPTVKVALDDFDGDGRTDVAVFADQDTPEGLASPAAVLVNAAPPACPPDVTGDGLIDFDDLNLVLINWGMTGLPWAGGDADGSGHVDFDDLNMVLLNWGVLCPG
ncbi:MAG: right-handed parallel beta-helix repeat-containing protein [Phycisphaerales bacterium]|nr:right-handed parallel beta-helix repeat-containing protein [Phycisphaerales bacterium]